MPRPRWPRPARSAFLPPIAADGHPSLDVPTHAQACKLPDDKALLEKAREAAALFMRENKHGPLQWPAELRAAVTDVSVASLDIASI